MGPATTGDISIETAAEGIAPLFLRLNPVYEKPDQYFTYSLHSESIRMAYTIHRGVRNSISKGWENEDFLGSGYRLHDGLVGIRHG
jgi:hypothetical protein